MSDEFELTAPELTQDDLLVVDDDRFSTAFLGELMDIGWNQTGGFWMGTTTKNGPALCGAAS